MRSLERFLSHIRFTPDGCWIWSGSISGGTGYGNFHVSGKTVNVHRWAYEEWNGPVPVGLELDHLCRNRACANPAHLEAVTRSENFRRGIQHRTEVGPDLLPTHCVNGHPWNEINTYIRPDNGKRACRACKRERMRIYKARERAA